MGKYPGTALLCFLLAGSGYSAEQSCVAAVGSTEIIAATGDPLPDGSGTFTRFENIWSYPFVFYRGPTINDLGQAAFMAETDSPDGGGVEVYRGGNSSLTQITYPGLATPDGNGTFPDPASYMSCNALINNQNQVLFSTALSDTANEPSDATGIYLSDGTEMIQIARAGQALPGGGTLDHTFVYTASNAALNDAGQVAFYTHTIGESTNLTTGLYLSDGSTITTIMEMGDTVPGGNGTFMPFRPNFIGPTPVMNNQGQFVFSTWLENTAGGEADDSGIFYWDGSVLTEVVQEGDAAPDGNGLFGEISIACAKINDTGSFAFNADLTGTIGGEDYERAIFLSDGSNISTIVRDGDNTPDGNSVFAHIYLRDMSSTGQITFSARLADANGTEAIGDGIYRYDGGSITALVEPGDTLPGSSTTFVNTGVVAANDQGQVLFSADLSDDDYGLFFFDDTLGIIKVVSENDALLGSNILDLTYGWTTIGGDEHSGFNNLGQFSYQFRLDNGRTGIAIWSPPIPGELNGDGWVGLDDLDIILAHWNQTVTPGDLLSGDPSGDGFVGLDDLDYVLGPWNTGTQPSGVAAPEPGSFALFLLSGWLMVRRENYVK